MHLRFDLFLRIVLVSLNTLVVVHCISANETASLKQRPNVILILADDLALGDLDHTGESGGCRTPALDRLASQSVRFTQAYSGSCVCAPARAALLTGRYPQRTGVVTLNMETFPELTRLHLDESTIADLMKREGYSTGLIGKWHLGIGKEFHPLQRGFDSFEGFIGADEVGYFQYRLDIQGQTTRVTDRYLTDDLSERAIEFVRHHRDRPFFLHLAHYAPHRPLEAPDEIIQVYRDQGFAEQTATIYAMIEVMDRGIGKLLDELDSLEIAGNTIVIFASDNGPDPLTGQRFNRQLRGSKYEIYEGGIRVPMWIRWTNELSAGDRSQLVHFIDVMPTVLDLCQIHPSRNLPLDGRSFAEVLRDDSAQFAPVRYWQWNRGEPNYTHNAAIRVGNFKLVRPFVTRGLNVVDSRLPAAMYDLSKDPTESNDIAPQHPDLAGRLNAELSQWTSSIESDRTRAIPVVIE